MTLQRKKRELFYAGVFIIALILCFGLLETSAVAASGEYLQYQEPKPSGMGSWFSTLAYVLSLLFTFAAVLAMAYFASRFLGGRMAGGAWGKVNSQRVLQTIPLGQNKAVSIVDAAGKVLVLGVTDASIVLLTEIVDAAEVERLRTEAQQMGAAIPFDDVLQRQLQSIQQLSDRFPKVFSRHRRGQQEQEGRNGE